MAEAAQLRDHLRQIYGIAPNSMIAEPVAIPDAIVDAPPLEPASYDVVMESVEPAHRIAAIRQVRESTNVSLKEARELVERVPCVIKQGLARDEADGLKTTLEKSGAKVVVRAAST